MKTANNNQRPAATNARYRTIVREFEHAERVMEKERRVEVLRTLLEMHQQQHEPDEYIKGLRQRLKRTQTQLVDARSMFWSNSGRLTNNNKKENKQT